MTYSLELNRVGKRYSQLQEQAMLLKSLLPGRTATKRDLWALRDVSFAVEPGETVGIIGRNGAGKTTLLRLSAGVSRPSEGRVRVHGRVAPLISVGVGFHQEMSGRENVLVNGMLLGLSRRQVARRFDEIVAFAELDDLIDTPVKFYSSGQYVRLGFAVAVHSDPEILLVDEVLAVGDLGFQLKCFDRMRELQGSGTTILLVSHSLHAVRLLCPRVLLFTKGRLVMDGPAETAIGRYHELLSAESTDLGGAHDPVTALSRSLESPDGPTHHPTRGDELRYRVELQFNQPVDSPSLSFQVTSETGIVVYAMNTRPRRAWRRFDPGDTVELEVAFNAQLGGGTYRLSVVVADRDARTLLATNVGEVPMYIAPRPGHMGWADLEARITACGTELSDYDDLALKADPDAGQRLNSGHTQNRFTDVEKNNVPTNRETAPKSHEAPREVPRSRMGTTGEVENNVLKIIGAGVGRTGTTSLKAAFERLLGGPCYHMHEVFQRPEHIPLWHDAVRGRPTDWATLYRGYAATLDWPGAAFWSALSHTFPNALVVLSLRDSDAWFKSVDATINELMRRRPQPSTKAWYAMAHDLLESSFAPFPVSRDTAIEAYNRHNAAVREAIPPERLLVWEPGDGWEPLCSRLGLPVPSEPFPHLNTTDDYRLTLDGLPRRTLRRRLRVAG